MSRIEKGGAKFRPLLPRMKRDATATIAKPPSAQKPQSSRKESSINSTTISNNLQNSTRSLETSSQEDTRGIPESNATVPPVSIRQSSSEAHLEQTHQAAAQAAVETENPAFTILSSDNSMSTRPVVTPLSMPSPSTRGSLISMPSQRRPQPLSAASQAPTSGTALAPSQSIIEPQPSTSTSEAATLFSPEVSPPTTRNRSKRAKIQTTEQEDLLSEAEEPPQKKRRRANPSTVTREKKKSNRAATSTRQTRSKTASGRSATLIISNENEEVIESHEAGPGDVSDTTEASEEEQRPFRRRRQPRPRIDKPVTVPPEEGPPVDETTVTMQDLCNGLGEGRVSSQFLETFVRSKTSARRKREDNARLRDITRRKELGLPLDEEETSLVSGRGRMRSQLSSTSTRAITDGTQDDELNGNEKDESAEEDEYGQIKAIGRAPKVRYNANGELVVDETELEYDRQAEADAEIAARGPVEVIHESDRDKFVNFGTYSRKPKPERWSKEETEIFYMGLRMFHTGFEMIARLLPNRTRTMVRNKYKAEDRKNPQYVTHLLSAKMRLPYDLELLSRETGKDFSGPIPQINIAGVIEAPPGDSLIEASNDEHHISIDPNSGLESEREVTEFEADGTSVSASGRDRSETTGNAPNGKRKRKSSKGSIKSKNNSVAPPSSASVSIPATASGALRGNSAISGVGSASEQDSSGMAAPGSTSTSTAPAPRVPIVRTALSSATGGTLVLPSGGRGFRRVE